MLAAYSAQDNTYSTLGMPASDMKVRCRSSFRSFLEAHIPDISPCDYDSSSFVLINSLYSDVLIHAHEPPSMSSEIAHISYKVAVEMLVNRPLFKCSKQ